MTEKVPKNTNITNALFLNENGNIFLQMSMSLLLEVVDLMHAWC